MLIGRSRKCDLRLAHPSVSGEHALVWWDGEHWRIRDLDSRNGLRVGGSALPSGQSRVLQQGDVLAFGHYPVHWTVDSTAPPAPRAIPLEGAPVEADDGLLVLPDPEAPVALIYADPYQGWVMEAGDTMRPVSDQELLTLAGQVWRLSLPSGLSRTVDPRSQDTALSALTLAFAISADEEHVRLTVHSGDQVHDLGTRAHHYALLTLARQRLQDADDPTLSEESRGWVYREDLADMLRLTRTHLNLLIFRARKQFAALNISDARDIIERRGDSQQLRIGSARLTVQTL